MEYRHSSQFVWEAMGIGVVTGIIALAFNQSALTTDFGQVFIHPAITFGAATIFALLMMFSRPLTQNRGGAMLTSLAMGTMVGIMIVSGFWHWGYGILCLVPITAAFCGRKLYYDHKQHGVQSRIY